MRGEDDPSDLPGGMKPELHPGLQEKTGSLEESVRLLPAMHSFGGRGITVIHLL